MTDLLRRVERLEQRVAALRTPEARRVIVAVSIGESEPEARARERVAPGEQCIFVAVEDASRR